MKDIYVYAINGLPPNAPKTRGGPIQINYFVESDHDSGRVNIRFQTGILIYFNSVPRFASAVIWSRGPRPWRGFTHGPLITAKCPTRVSMRPDHEHGNGMGRVDMEQGPDIV